MANNKKSKQSIASNNRRGTSKQEAVASNKVGVEKHVHGSLTKPKKGKVLKSINISRSNN